MHPTRITRSRTARGDTLDSIATEQNLEISTTIPSTSDSQNSQITTIRLTQPQEPESSAALVSEEEGDTVTLQRRPTVSLQTSKLSARSDTSPSILNNEF